MLKAFKFRLYPTLTQAVQLNQHIGSCRFVYNWALDQKIITYEQTGKSVSRFDLNKMIPALKESNKWLGEVNSQSLQGMTKQVESAFTRFFREKNGFPRFKSKKNPIQSFPVPQHYTVNFDNNTVKLPKIGEIKAVLHRVFEGELKTATVSKSCKGYYYISILVEDGNEIPVKQEFSDSTTVGIDVGIKDFAVLSTGEKIENPRHLKNSLQRLKVLQKRVSKKQKGSQNRAKAKQRLSSLHDKIANQRNDFQNKLSFKLISENQAIALETLNVKGMIKNHNLAQSIGDSAWSSFVTKLEYKAAWLGKTVLRIGQFEPSSKLCSMCGYHNKELQLRDREWECPECATKHDRDINAAINIKKFALIDQNLICL
ncbi:transposase, IS605 OrfB family, central region [Methanomethylovorans hollandica DSM 15978]|uniref:Transposase, IS605 OrfB family, central region n=1 Tax=Methanomethylovorans hollandica (strain DSM 15978 / NBRC 107637 / DMS1) TaxID=867904 RepID=L0KW33_METHD|nr:IS200/IS605 family element RNA-guided endonuclease TnpB [Methanomethylovorans hollandica]AGB49667.1 transposase, IS605 OrfB family, central region [Methanomethylovorans hollandica DSM 15978]